MEKIRIERRITKSIAKIIEGEHGGGRDSNQRKFLFKRKLSQVQRTMKAKVSCITKERFLYWNDKLFNQKSYEVTNWRNEIDEEINETFNNCNTEIDSTIEPYKADPKDCPPYEIHTRSRMYRRYMVHKTSIQNDMKSLLNYIEWRLENSYEFILCKTVALADFIKMNMSEFEVFPLYDTIKSKERHIQPKAYKTLVELDQIS